MDILNQAPLRVIFLSHLILITWAIHDQWLSTSYTFYNTFFLACLLWSMHSRDSDEPVLIAGLIDVGSILLDIIEIAENYHGARNAGFSIFMCIANLLLRPLTVLLLLKVFNDRNGRYTQYGFGGIGGDGGMGRNPGGRGAYEDLDSPQPAGPHHQSVPSPIRETDPKLPPHYPPN